MGPFWQKILNHRHHFQFLFTRGILLCCLLCILSSGYGQDNAKNKKPKITGQKSLTINEGESITIQLTDLFVEDPDDWFYPWGFSLTIGDGANYTVNGNTVTPSPDFDGTLSVMVTVNDGDKDSEPYALQVTVIGINDAPVIQNQSEVVMDEDTQLEISTAHLTIYDPEQNSFTLTVQNGEHYSINGLIITPETNYSGPLSIPVTASDGFLSSNQHNLLVTVTEVNDAPVIQNQTAVAVDEDNPLNLSPTILVIDDPEQTSFTLTARNGEHYSVDGSTVIPESNYSGPLTIPVVANDGLLTSNEFNMLVNVNSVNDKPVIASQQALLGEPEVPLTITLENLIVNDPDNTYPTDFSLLVLNGDHYTVSGTTLTPATDFEGNLTVMVRVSDGSAESESFPLNIEVKKGNKKPVIVNQQPVIINEDQSYTIRLSDLEIRHDSDEPGDFSLAVEPGDNYTVEGSNIKPTTNFSGNLFVKITVTKRNETSPVFSFQITVSPVNDAPVLTSSDADSIYLENDQSTTAIFSNITITDIDNKALTLAEIAIDPGDFDRVNDVLTFTNTPEIKGIFDAPHGLLALIGKASIAQYIEALKSVELNIGAAKSFSKKVSVSVSDGEATSNKITRTFYRSESNIEFVIPSGFTPNGDLVNDTWFILPPGTGESFLEAQVRIYSKSGLLVFEANDLTKAWDGVYNGSTLPADVYYYTIDFKTDPLQPATLLKGIVTILR